MFTNEEVRTAMTSLVEEKGPDHTSFGRFLDPVTGKGACFLGALCEHMGRAIPMEGVRAQDILGRGAVSDEMGIAFSVAMSLNDARFQWKYIIKAVDMVLDSKDGLSLGPCPCGCRASTGVGEIIQHVRALRALDMAHSPKCPVDGAGFAQGGFITNAAGLIPTFSKITMSIDDMSVSAFSIQTAIANTIATANMIATPTVAAKKDHALVA